MQCRLAPLPAAGSGGLPPAAQSLRATCVQRRQWPARTRDPAADAMGTGSCLLGLGCRVATMPPPTAPYAAGCTWGGWMTTQRLLRGQRTSQLLLAPSAQLPCVYEIGALRNSRRAGPAESSSAAHMVSTASSADLPAPPPGPRGHRLSLSRGTGAFLLGFSAQQQHVTIHALHTPQWTEVYMSSIIPPWMLPGRRRSSRRLAGRTGAA